MPHRSGEKYLQPYREAVQQYGPGFEATLWNSREAQQLRFDVMIDLAELREGIILDAGCGTGDFAARLLERNVHFARYVGVDAVSEMIDAAKQRNLPRCEFCTANLLHDPHILHEIAPAFVCISGTLNTMDEHHAQHFVQAAFNSASQGVAFNFLSNRASSHWKTRDIGPARRFNTVDWIDWSLNQTPLVSFSQEYMDGHDATIVMRKKASKQEAIAESQQA